MEIEERCAALAARQQFLRPAGIAEWPDGTVAARYGVQHALYQRFWHEQVSVSNLQRLHLRIGECKETAYGQRAGEIATELAIHFEQARDYGKAVRYMRRAGENAIRRNAHQEAIFLLTKGLALQQHSERATGNGQREKDSDPQPPILDPQAETEAYFLKAIETARSQQAKSWELRATMSLARLWRSQGKRAAAHKALSEIYNWFTEGFDTADLKEAKALIEELGH